MEKIHPELTEEIGLRQNSHTNGTTVLLQLIII